MSDSNDLIRQAMANPAAARHEIERMKCEGSLYEFVRAGWHTLHPGTEFVGGWAIKTMCAHLEAVTRGDITRLLINVPPGCTKSMLVNVFWPCWEWGPKGLSHYKYIATAHEKGLVIDLMARAREVLKSEWYQSHWPLTFKADADGKEYYATTGQGSRFAGSVTSKLTGRRGHRFIIDDPHSVASAESDTERTTAGNWFTETTPTRFDDQENPVYVIIMQRLHMMDISGIVIKELASKGQDWTHVCLPMEFEEKYRSWSCVPSTHGQPKMMRRVLDDGEPLPYYVEDEENGILLWPQDPRQVDGDLLWPERFSRKAIEELKVQFRAVGGSYAEAAQLQQRPVPRGGGMFDRANFVFVDECPELIAECRGYDLAATDDNKAAWTVGAKVGRTRSGQIVIADVDRYRKGPGDVETAVLSCAIRDGVNCPISIPQDPGQAGKSQVRAFAALLNGYNARFSPESGSKENRAIPLAAQVEAGNVLIVRGPWNDAFLAEAGLFPNSQFKDQVDAITRAYDYLLQNAGPKLALTPGKMIQY